MRTSGYVPAVLLTTFLISISVGVSQGTEDQGDFLLRDYKSESNKTFKNILTTDVNVLVLTETSCYSCIKELKAMESLRARFPGKVSISAIFLDREGWPRVKKYLDFYAFDLDFSLVDSSQSVPARFKTNYVPTIIAFDRNGMEIYRKKGFSEEEETEISGMIEGLLYPERTRSAGISAPGPASAGARVENAPVVKSSGCASTPS